MVKPERLNQLDIDTRWGFRSFEVWHGDITKLNFPINLLLIAQPGRSPTYSLHRSLQSELSISVHDLKETQEARFLCSLLEFGCPAASRVKGCSAFFAWRSCRIPQAPQKIREAFRVFPILAMREIDIGTICLPILGAGGIGLKAEDVVGPILDRVALGSDKHQGNQPDLLCGHRSGEGPRHERCHGRCAWSGQIDHSQRRRCRAATAGRFECRR